MTRKLIQDIIVKKNSPAPLPKESAVYETKENQKFAEKNLHKVIIPPKLTKERGKGRIFYFFSVPFLFVVIGFYLLSHLSSMTVVVTPKQDKFLVDASFDAAEDPSQKDLSYKTADVNISVQEIFGRATERKETSQAASGIVLIYNKSDFPQTLIGDESDKRRETRFETPDGKIFRIHKTITIPAAKIDVPGSAETVIYAEEAGENYNIGLSDFNIPGLKGTPQYSKIYARSKTAITGGFIGKALTVSSFDYAKARNELIQKIQKQAMESIVKDIPDGFILFPDAFQVDAEEANTNPRIGAKVSGDLNQQSAVFSFKGSGRVRAFLFKNDELGRAILKLAFLKDDSGARINNLKDLSFSVNSVDKNAKIFSFSIKGNAQIVWNIDKNALIGNLISASNDPLTAFKDFPNIEKARIIYRPSWWTKIPSDPTRIIFKEELGEALD